MKKIILILGLALVSVSFYGQSKAIDELFDKYAGKEGFTTVNINGGLLALASLCDNDQDTKALLKDLTHIRILAMEKDSGPKINFYKEIIGNLPVQDYKELMTVKEKNQDVKMLVKESNGMISELLMIVGGDDNALISITGLIDPKNLSKVTKAVRGEHQQEE